MAKRKAKKRKRKAVKRTKRKKATRRKKTAKKKKRKANAGFMKPMTPSKILAEIIGTKALPRTQITKKIWKYIKKHRLQDKVKRTMINADAKLKVLFGGRRKATMFELTKFVNKHIR